VLFLVLEETMDNSDAVLIIKDRPIGLWIVGLIFTAVGSFMLLSGDAPIIFSLIFFIIGVLMLALTSVLTITADKMQRTLTLSYRSLFRNSEKVIPFSELASFDVETKVSHDSDGTSTTFNLVARTKDGNVVPFRSYSSSGRGGKEKTAQRLRDFIGVGGVDLGNPTGAFNKYEQASAQVYKNEQESITGSQDETHITNGVHWRLNTIAFGNSPVMRWISTDFRLPDSFVYVAQILPGQKALTSGLLGGLGGMMFKQSLNIYGITTADTPGIGQAEAMQNIDPRLESNFMVYTNSPATARQILNPWVIMPLAAWAQKYPLRQIQSGYANQLAVHYGPNGVMIAMLGLTNPEHLEEVTALGVELVKSQIA